MPDVNSAAGVFTVGGGFIREKVHVFHLLKPNIPFDLLFLKTAEAEIIIITLLLTRDKEERGGDGATSCNICNICSFSITTPMGEFLRYTYTIWQEEIR